MTARENILLCLRQYAAAGEQCKRETGFDVGEHYCISNLLEQIDWHRIPAAKWLEIFAFILDRCDIRAVARMSGTANDERTGLRRVLAEMAADGEQVIDIDDVAPLKQVDADRARQQPDAALATGRETQVQ